MLLGSESDISVEDWKAHTDYHGYLQTDPQICWFWKIIEGMTAEQRKALLFFWISMKNLPVEGFGGLSVRLNILKSNATIDHLPFSHTCLYQFYLPAYPSISMMKDRLSLITRNHFCCSFGIH
ncbi:hypothetical protein OSB04_012628 [Centaurea solstitialis]|nr:hypothetical protein OSB04_012628 [Centaurea solstitialis]